MPASRDAITRLVGELLDTLLDLLEAKDFTAADAERADAVGARLVTAQFTGPTSLSRTIRFLGDALPSYPTPHGPAAGRVAALLGALSGGYVVALRSRILDQQETVKAALLTAYQRAQRGLLASETKFRELFTSSAIGIAISDDDGLLVDVNAAFAAIVKRPTAELVGSSLYDLFQQEDATLLRTTHQNLTDGMGQRPSQRLRLLDSDGETAWTHLAVSLLHGDDGLPAGHVTMFENVTDLHLLGERLSHQSLHDALTGLHNQQFFVSRMETVLGRDGPARPITLCKIDLDGFTVVNDGLGRHVGDQLLRSVAARLQDVVARENATVARFGADEFAILIENSPTTPDVATLAESINAELAEPVYLDGHGLAVTSCIGIVEHNGTGAADPAELLRAAEATLRRLKATGPRQWGLFDVHRDAGERATSRLAAVMPGAWENGEISLEYRPLYRLADGAVAGIRPLLRWDRDGHKPMSHRECLELADATGLALPLGEWMLRRACFQHATWERLAAETSRPTPPLYIDLTPRQADDPDLVSTVRRAVENAGSTIEHLRLGIPARPLRGESGDAEDNLQVLAGMGVGVGLVEVGGATDLLLLDDLPPGSVRSVRMARILVRRVGPTPDLDSAAEKALTGLLGLVRSYDAAPIAAGITTREQADWWCAIGADIGQGPFFGRPVPPHEAAELVGLRVPQTINREG